LRFIDLFCGIGGFRIALENFNQKCVFSADNNKFACETYYKNFNEFPFIDIKKYDLNKIPDFEILCAGFPCQPFSIAGYRKGFKDARGTLFFDIVRIIKTKKPKIIFLENVKGLLSHNKGKTFRTIIKILAKKENGIELNNKNNLGYNIFWKVLNSNDYNIPQNRERLFIIGFKDQSVKFSFPEKEKLKIKLENIIKKNNEESKIISKQSKNYIKKFLLKKNNYKIIKNLKYLVANEVRKSRCHFRYDNISPCLTTKMGTGGNNVPYLVNYDRFFSIKELLQLQGFPKNFKLCDSYNENLKQIGNSVTINVISKIFKSILSTQKY